MTETKADWNIEDADDEIVVSPAPAPEAAAPIAQMKPDVMAHQSTPDLVLPKPEIAPESKNTVAPASSKPDFSNLPTDPKEIEKRLRFRRPPYTPEEQEMRRRYFASQQVEKSPDIDLNAVRVAQHKAIVNAPQWRIDSLNKYTDALTADNFTDMAITPRRNIGEILNRILGEMEIQVIIALIRKVGCVQAIIALENFAVANPRRRLEELKKLISSTTDLETLRQLNEESIGLNSPHTSIVAQNVRSLLITEYEQSLKPLLIRLLDSAISFAESYKAEAVQHEQEFFRMHGVKHEPTGVSRKFDIAIADLRHRKAQLTTPPVTMHISSATAPSAEDTVLNTVFELDLIE